MPLDRAIRRQLERYVQVFKEARERGANEADTVMYLVKMFEDVFGYDSLKGEVSKEVAIRDRYCDMCIKLNGDIQFLIEVKSAGIKKLRDKYIEQAENYGSRSGIQWIVLTTGVLWRLYHLSYNEGEGIVHELVFELNLVDAFEKEPELMWENLSLLTRENVSKDSLETHWEQRKVLAPASLVRVLFSEPVLQVIRRELNRKATARLDLRDVFSGVRDALAKEALLEAGDIDLPKKKRRRRRKKKTGATDTLAAQAEGEEADEEVDDKVNGEDVEDNGEGQERTPAEQPPATPPVEPPKPE